MKYITRAVLILSVVSLLNDVSSEMLYPIMPMFLKSIGFTAAIIGLLEGIAEAVAGLGKGYFGQLSDQSGKRLPFVKWGYFLSAIGKSMPGLYTFTAWIFSSRSLDKVGKGLRTAARDAMLSDETTKENKGKVFGFHRGMDTLGAVVGPAIALIWIFFRPGEYKNLFLISFLPAIICVGFLFLLKEKQHPQKKGASQKKTIFNINLVKFWLESGAEYKKVVGGLLAFAFFNSSNFFLLLMMKQKGLTDAQIIEVYIFYNIIYAAASYPFGGLGDRMGMKTAFLIGLVMFAVVYGGMALTDNLYVYYGLFFLYGLYSAATDGIASAWVSNISKQGSLASGIGFYSGMNSIFLLFSSVIAGLVWDRFGATATFTFSAIGAAMVAVYFMAVKFYHD